MIKVIAFDAFGTLFNMEGVPEQQLRDYGDHLRKFYLTKHWTELKFPTSWIGLPAFPDVKEGIARLMNKHICVLLSNGPADLLHAMLGHNGIVTDGIVPLEAYRTFKPDLSAYVTVCQLWKVIPCEVMMVTANEHFGDLEAASILGMAPRLIRHEELQAREYKTYKDLNALADAMGL